ncbi:CRISPR-associated endonuclease Cas1 [Deferrisoma camini]|uniref:CRISPR-associated endonuclease Cas1 n=1 Tax=Deferrisoma camini TaxID=1035120 RepID=UPI00046CA75A|nr:CRISPR-associated endonuclease Cas1 [Deferrisoma camini]
MGTLVVDSSVDEVRRDGQTLTLYKGGKLQGRVPVPPLERVVFQGGLRVDTRALHLLADQGVSVHFLSGRHGQWRATLVGQAHNDAGVRMGQFAAYHHGPTRLAIAREIVERKLRAQADNLLLWTEGSRPADAKACRAAAAGILEIAARVPAASAESLLGHEGAAARAYFDALARVVPASYGFAGRTRRPPTDPVNALLSLGYTLLHAEWERLVRLVGLDPAVGFYHALEFGRPSLVCDLVEPWRPAYDRWVVQQLRERAFRSTDFARGGARAGCWLKPAARKRFYLGFEGWAQPLRGAWRTEARDLAARLAERAAEARAAEAPGHDTA